MIGSDCPRLDKKTIDIAFKALEEHDLVLGPALDGGIYLIGLRKMNEEILDDVDWGSDSVFKKIFSNAEGLSFSTSILESKQDVDRLDDFLNFEEEYEEYREIMEDVTKKAS